MPDLAMCPGGTCPKTTAPIARHQELSDEDVARASLDEMRVAYRSLRDHHVAETSALISRRDDLTRRRDEQLAKSNETLGKYQKLIEQADEIMRRDEEVIDRLGDENAKLNKIIADQRVAVLHVPSSNHSGKFKGERQPLKREPSTVPKLTSAEANGWQACAHVHAAPPCEDPECYVDELRERRDAEVLFIEIDRRFQDVVDCAACDEGGPDGCREHETLIRAWRNARSALYEHAYPVFTQGGRK